MSTAAALLLDRLHTARLSDVTAVEPVEGGQAALAGLATRLGGSPLFVESFVDVPAEDLFAAETQGLAVLRERGGLATPEVILAARDVLVLSVLHPRPAQEAFSEQLAHALARLHATTAHDTFGWERDNWLGRYRQPYKYTRAAHDVNGQRVAPFPAWLADLGRSALTAAYQDPHAADSYTPDTALINFYDDQARMGMHQDKDERCEAPVVSLSIGDTCVFRFGNTEHRGKPYTDVELASGDLFVFGGPARFAYHGVPKIHPGTGDPATGLSSGRLNLTLHVTGLSD